MVGLEEKKVVFTGTRRLEDLRSLVESRGGVALIRPTQGTAYAVEDELKPYIQRLVDGYYHWIVLTTGGGTEALLQVADTLGQKDQLIEVLRHSKVAVRGYKTHNLLKKLGIEPAIRDENGTTADLIHALESYDLTGNHIAIQLYGEPLPELTQFLKGKKAEFDELYPYKYHAPDLEVLKNLVYEIVQGEVDAVAFTSAVQVRNLIQYAEEAHQLDALQKGLNEQVLAGAVGKVTAETLNEAGIHRVIKPEHERMGALVVALENFFKENESN